MGNSLGAKWKEPESKIVELKINGKKYAVPASLPGNTSLNAFIRDYAHLTGTKFMCYEGGCGACIVSVQSKHPTTGELVTQAVNSCLIPIYSCHGWSITTVEGLGSKAKGYHKIQKRLEKFNGTQCGYCSPGMVMNMYSLLEANPKITMKEVEDSFGGNICRCTGYRPILEAFKSLASDAPPELTQKVADIEDLKCPKSGKMCNGNSCGGNCGDMSDWEEVNRPSPNTTVHVALEGDSNWFKPSNLQEIFEIFDQIGDRTYSLVAGNTGHGVYGDWKNYYAFIDINGIPEIHGSTVRSDGLTLGANINLTEAMNLFYKLAKQRPNEFSYLNTLADHIDLIANVPVRNVGTFAGNLIMKHKHTEFPSDVFVILEMVSAKVVIADKTGVQQEMGLLEYLSKDMNRKVMVKINLPTYDKSFVTKSFKIMPRAQNAAAYVNAGFLVKVDKNDGFKVLEKPRIVFGGINPKFIHAEQTEEFLVGKKLMDSGTLKTALDKLEKELNPDHVLPDASPEYRKGLALSLFYKFILSLDPSKVEERYRSGGRLLERPVSTAKQDFDTDRSLWPLNQPIPKIEGLIQCSGEAEFANDIPSFPGQLWAQLVLTDRLATVAKIDPSEALKLPGVWGIYTADDIPGENEFQTEVIFVKEGSPASFAGQAVCVVLADTHTKAVQAANLVKVSYIAERKALNDVRDIIKNGPKNRIKQVIFGKGNGPEKRINPVHQTPSAAGQRNETRTIKGQWDIGAQYHFTMETHTCVAVPSEDQLDVYPSTQGPQTTLSDICYALNVPQSHVNLRVRRVGGGFGCKLSRGNHAAAVVAVSAHLSRKPVRMVLQLENNMQWAGKRMPLYTDYTVEVSETGEIQSLDMKLYGDVGYGQFESCVSALGIYGSCYDISRWKIDGYNVITDKASNAACRGPGTTEGIALMETIMDHIACTLGKDPIQVRLANMNEWVLKDLPPMISEIKESASYLQRIEEIRKFNEENRWMKRAISVVAMGFPFSYQGARYHALVGINADGTVVISHGGIEMGQGLNTKAAQAAACRLQIDINKISVKPTYAMLSPEDAVTGGSLGSESVAGAVYHCCTILNNQLDMVKKLNPTSSWEEWIRIATNPNNKYNADLLAVCMFDGQGEYLKNYTIYGVTVCEVEVDVLTGQYQMRRVDVLEDAGRSLSPEVDIGQVEGGFMMGAGYYTSEQLVYDPNTGKNLTDRTWTYKPPGAKDIPIDFRVTLRKNALNEFGVLKSKATGEPPLCMSVAVPIAIRRALISARKDAGLSDSWAEINAPFTAENIWLSGLTKKEQMVL